MFKRTNESARLVCYAGNDIDSISNLLIKLGIRLDVNAIPLRGGRAKVFKGEYYEFEDPFPLMGDFATSAVCKKIQSELGFDLISTLSVKAESGDYLILSLLPSRIHDARTFFGQFGSLFKYAVYLSNLRSRLEVFEKRFDEQFIKMKNEFIEKEGEHLHLYDVMPIPACILDESGIITEANQALRDLFGRGTDAIGQPLSSIMEEETRQNFVEFLLSLKIRRDDSFPLKVSDRYFKARIISLDDNNQIVVYLFDETAGVNIKAELDRTIDTLRKENELADKLTVEEKKHSEDVVKNSPIPTLAIHAGKIEFASESLKRIFTITDSADEFTSCNGIPTLSESDSTFETPASDGRTFSVSQWSSGEYHYLAFSDVTDLKKAAEDSRKISFNAEKLFNSIFPTARVVENKIVEWNGGFESLLKDFLANEKSFDGFLRYLSESPEAIKSELRSKNVVTRTCHATDRKNLNVCLSAAADSIFIFVEDITEQENLRQELRNTQNLLANSIEFFSEEPIFILENGTVSAANLAAREKLAVKLNESLNIDTLFSGLGALNRTSTVELDGKFFRIESATLSNSTVFHLREVTEGVVQRAEINKLKHHHDLLKELATSEQYENILTNLKEILAGETSPKLICAGILYAARESADVYLLTVATDKIEPSLSLSLTQADMSFAGNGGLFSRAQLPDTSFSNIVSAGGDSRLAIESTPVGDICGFASAAIPENSPEQNEGIDQEAIDELREILSVASSTAADIYTRLSAQRKFEESGKVTRALVGLTGISDGSLGEISKKTVDLLKQVFTADSIAIYSIDGPRLTLSTINGSLPSTVSIPSIKFGMMVPAAQLAADPSFVKGEEVFSSEGVYFCLKSRQQNLALMFKFVGVTPAPSELNAVSSIALDLLESKRAAETHARTASDLSGESRLMNDFITGLSKADDPNEVLTILEDYLKQRDKGSSVSAAKDAQSSVKPLDVVQKDGGELYEANFLTFGIGVIEIKTSADPLAQMMIQLTFDKLRSLLASELPAARDNSAELQTKLDKANSDLSTLRDSVDKIPATMRNARIEIDGVLSRLSFVQGDEKIIEEIKMRLASATKDLSIDLDSSYTNQDAIFESIRSGVMEHEAASERIRNFDISALTEFRAESTVSELIKDIFVNFIIISEVPDCEVLMMTALPSPSELADGKGKHIGVRLTTRQGAVLRDDTIKSNGSIQALVNKIEKMGYQVDTRALGNELTTDVCEVKRVEMPKGESAILIEDDRALLEEESQYLLQIYSRLKVAGDAVEAAKIFESEKFSAAFVDLSLPSINGKEVCQQIKKTQPECMTILLTNREGEDKSNGVDHIMLRPMTEEAVRNLIGK